MSPLLLVAILLTQRIAYVEGNCYTPNGEDRNAQFNVVDGYLYQPCHPEAAHSMCCAKGPGRQANPDQCSPDGLCDSSDRSTWRESCTDRTWQAPECLKLFINGTGFENNTIILDGSLPINDVTVRRCDNGSFCYGSYNQACCIQGQGVWLDSQGRQVSVNPNATTISSTASTPSSTPASSSSPTTTSNTSGKSGLSTGAQAGIGAGVGGAALVLAVAVGCWLYQRRRNQHKANDQQSTTPKKLKHGDGTREIDSSPRHPWPVPEYPQAPQHPQELDDIGFVRKHDRGSTQPVEIG